LSVKVIFTACKIVPAFSLLSKLIHEETAAKRINKNNNNNNNHLWALQSWTNLGLSFAVS
jgi:hypothetical protein